MNPISNSYRAGYEAGHEAGECSIKQRYEQLEQVAKEMLGTFNQLRKLDDTAFCRIARETIEDACTIHHEQIEALGVSADD